ncbi:MAG: hypothetical protein LC689_22750 [Myxococcales bacterium]|nr:hypothetical protein [Myxococcales bacterium]
MRSLALLLLVGCTPGVYYSMSHRGDVQPTAPVAPARVDVQASEVVVEAEGFGGGVSSNEVRSSVAQALQEYLAGGPNARPARFRLEGRTSVTGAAIMWLFPCFVDLILVGCPVNVQSAHVELTVQVGDRKYTGAGDSWTLGGLYYNHNTQGALGRATAHALERVFENARAER